MKQHKLRSVILWCLVAALLVTIFVLSDQKAEDSEVTSGGVIEVILRLLRKDFDSLNPQQQLDAIEAMQSIVRTLAHFSEYGLLGFLLYGAMRSSELFPGRTALFGVLFCLLYAVSDEIHQYFVEGRACQLGDVIVDTCGAAAGTALLWLILYLIAKRGKKDA